MKMCDALFTKLAGRSAVSQPLLRSAAVALWAICLSPCGTPKVALQAQPIPPELAAPAQAYHRVFVPADNVDAWPRDGEKYLPIERREFEALVAAANRRAQASRAGATIAEARYSARLEGNRLAAGRGEWTIELHDDNPVFLPLGEMSVVLREPRWKEDRTPSDHAKSGQHALVGMWGASGAAADEWGLEISRSGVLEFDWHANSAAAQEGISIELRMPAANTTRLVLELPEGKIPLVDKGVVVRSEPVPAADGDNSDVRWRWELAIAASNAGMLRIMDVGGAATNTATEFGVREDLTYHVTERGLEFEITFEFEDLTPQLREVVVPLPTGVQLMSASTLNQELGWHLVSSGSSAGVSAVVSLPAASSRESRRITLRAWQPLVIDQTWRLPKLRPSGALWTDGNIELAVSPALVLQRLIPSGCQQSGGGQPASDRSENETYSFAAYSTDAALEIAVAPGAPDVAAQVVSSLALAETDVNGSLAARMRVSGGGLHKLSGDVAPGWTIDAVETEPSEALSEWFVARKNDGSEIEIQLTPETGSIDELTVIATARLQGNGITQALPIETLRMIRWRNVRVEQHVLSFQTIEPYVVEPTGGLPLYVPEPPEADPPAALEASEPTGAKFDITAPPDEAGLRVAVKRGQYEADVWVHATCFNNELRQEFHVVARPKASHIDRLLVYATQSLGDDVQWIERRSGAALVAERLPGDSRRSASLPAQGETWLVRLPHPTGKPVEIVTLLNSAWSERGRLPLISVPEAIEQQGRVLVRGSVQRRPLIEVNAMRAVPLPLDSELSRTSIQPGSILFAYRYNPADCLSQGDAPDIWIAPADFVGLDPIIVRRAAIESFYMSYGRAVHQVDYHLQHQGSRRLSIGVPARSTLCSLALDGRDIEAPAVNLLEDPIQVTLPAEAATSVLTARFETRVPRLQAGGRLQPPLLEASIPILTGHWTIWLPAEFSAFDAGSASLESGPNVRKRLFGPLARPNDAAAFNPFRRASWSSTTTEFDRRPESLSDVATKDDESAETLAGWRAHQFPFVAELPPTAIVTRPAAIVTWSIAAFLTFAVTGRWIWRRRRDAFVVFLASAAALALLLPEVFSPLATGVFIGLVCSLLISGPGRPLIEDSPTKTWSRPASVVARIGIFVAANLAVLAGGVALGQRGAGTDETEITAATKTEQHLDGPTIHRVLIPMDASGRAAGTKTYVSERFLRELHQASATGVHRHWILLGADYQGKLRDHADGGEITAGDWTMTFRLEVLARDTTIVLPLVRDEADWTDTATLDGIPAPLVWSESGGGCLVQVAEPGQHELVISCVPRFLEEASRNRVELTVPPIAGATARLEHPSGLADVKLSGTAVERVDSARGALVAELDGSDRITVDWPRVSANEGRAAGPRVTALRWLRIGVEEAELDTKFIVEGGGRQPETVTLEADNRWELQQRNLPAEVSPGSDGKQTIRVSLPASAVDGQVVSLRWRLAEAPALGRFRLPPVELTSLPIAQQWLAISSASALKVELVDGENASPGTANEFMAMWGAGLGVIPPELVLDTVEAGADLALAIEPRAAETTIDGLLHVAAGNDGLRVQYNAAVTPGGNDQFQLALSAFEDITIDKVVLSQSGQQIASRWARDAEGILTVFFGQQLTDQYDISVSGRVPPADGGSYMVPDIHAVGNESALRLQLYGGDDTLVELAGASEKTASRAPSLEPLPAGWTAAAAGAFELDRHSVQSARIVVGPNRVETTGRTHTVLSREADGWWATFGCRLKVEQGRMGAFRLAAPSTWRGPIAIKSNVEASLATEPLDERRTMLAVRFVKPLEPGQDLDLELRGRLATESASPPAVPEIAPTSVVRGARFVSVPTVLDSQPVAWSETGVKRAEWPRAELPADLSADLPADLPRPKGGSNWATYEVVASSFQVALRPVVVEQPVATVRLVDTFVSSGPSGNRVVYTCMVVVSQNLPECILELPQDQELLRVSADGRPAAVRPAAVRPAAVPPAAARPGRESQWRLTLGPAQLPQFIEILSRSVSEDGATARRVELARPRLLIGDAPIPVEMSLWSFCDVGYLGDAIVSGADRVGRAQQAASRLDRMVSISEAATPAALEASFPDGYNWYYPWAARLIELRNDLHANRPSGRAAASSQVRSAADEQLAQASDRLDAWLESCDTTLAWSDVDPSPPATSARALVSEPPIELAGNHWIHLVADGGNPMLPVERPSMSPPGQAKVAALALVAFAAAATLSLLRRPAARDALCRWPHAFAFLLGIAYWAALWPSWLGIVIAIASVIFALRSGWPGRSMRREGSTVLRLPPR
jgi:hypothetical protein